MQTMNEHVPNVGNIQEMGLSWLHGVRSCQSRALRLNTSAGISSRQTDRRTQGKEDSFSARRGGGGGGGGRIDK